MRSPQYGMGMGSARNMRGTASPEQDALYRELRGGGGGGQNPFMTQQSPEEDGGGMGPMPSRSRYGMQPGMGFGGGMGAALGGQQVMGGSGVPMQQQGPPQPSRSRYGSMRPGMGRGMMGGQPMGRPFNPPGGGFMGGMGAALGGGQVMGGSGVPMQPDPREQMQQRNPLAARAAATNPFASMATGGMFRR